MNHNSVSRTIIDGSSGHRSMAVETLALAFHADPALAWIFPDPAARRRRLPRTSDGTLPSPVQKGSLNGHF